MEFYQVIMLLGGLVLLVLLVKSFVEVPEGYQGLVFRWGRYQRTLGAGWAFVIPWFDYLERTVSIKISTTAEEELQVVSNDAALVPIRYSISYRVVDAYKACHETSEYISFVWGKVTAAIVQHVGSVNHADFKRAPQTHVDRIRLIAHDDLSRVGVELTNINFVHVGDAPGQASLMDTPFRAGEESGASETRAASEQKIAELKSEERAEALKLVALAEFAQLEKFTKIFGCAIRAGRYLADLRKIEATRAVANSANTKLIFMGEQDSETPTLAVQPSPDDNSAG